MSVFDQKENDVNAQWECFMNIFHLIFEKHFPLKLVHINNRTTNYYNTPEVIDSKKKLDVLLLLKSRNKCFKSLYDEEKRRYDRLLLQARVNYYNNVIQRSDKIEPCGPYVGK